MEAKEGARETLRRAEPVEEAEAEMEGGGSGGEAQAAGVGGGGKVGSAVASQAAAAADAVLLPPAINASVEERRRYAYAPLESPSGGDGSGFCLLAEGMGAAALETAATLAVPTQPPAPSRSNASSASSAGNSASAATRHVACIVADARHPLVFAPPALYDRLSSVAPTPPHLVLCLTKVDLVSWHAASNRLRLKPPPLGWIRASCRSLSYSAAAELSLRYH